MHLMVATVIVMWFDVNAQRLRIWKIMIVAYLLLLNDSLLRWHLLISGWGGYKVVFAVIDEQTDKNEDETDED